MNTGSYGYLIFGGGAGMYRHTSALCMHVEVRGDIWCPPGLCTILPDFPLIPRSFTTTDSMLSIHKDSQKKKKKKNPLPSSSKPASHSTHRAPSSAFLLHHRAEASETPPQRHRDHLLSRHLFCVSNFNTTRWAGAAAAVVQSEQGMSHHLFISCLLSCVCLPWVEAAAP